MTQFELFDDTFDAILSEKSYDQFKKLLQNSNCRRCALSKSRTHIVVDRGNPSAKIVFIGEAPGENEDLQGKAFVGRAGKILDEMMKEIGLDTNHDALIINVVKCRPPENRAPLVEEAKACNPFLVRQLALVHPHIIILLGATALKYLAKDKKEFEMHREVGKFFSMPEFPDIDFFVVYHPAYLLYDPRKKDVFRAHLKELRQYLIEKKLFPAGTGK